MPLSAPPRSVGVRRNAARGSEFFLRLGLSEEGARAVAAAAACLVGVPARTPHLPVLGLMAAGVGVLAKNVCRGGDLASIAVDPPRLPVNGLAVGVLLKALCSAKWDPRLVAKWDPRLVGEDPAAAGVLLSTFCKAEWDPRLVAMGLEVEMAGLPVLAGGNGVVGR